MKKIFLTAAWKNLVMANYIVDPDILLPYLPAHIEMDYFNGQCFVSLVGFVFEQVRVKGISIPFHKHFPEINLRFYVRYTASDGTVKRGVVFISEIVPKRAIAWVANNIYKEKYIATSMTHAVSTEKERLVFDYSWHWKGNDNRFSATVDNHLLPIDPGTNEAFIFEHYFGFAKVNASTTNEYAVEHPFWKMYPVHSYFINCNFENFYGAHFSFLDNAIPASVFVAEGSSVVVRGKSVLK